MLRLKFHCPEFLNIKGVYGPATENLNEDDNEEMFKFGLPLNKVFDVSVGTGRSVIPSKGPPNSEEKEDNRIRIYSIVVYNWTECIISGQTFNTLAHIIAVCSYLCKVRSNNCRVLRTLQTP